MWDGLRGCTDELVYLVSVGVECVCVKGSLVLFLSWIGLNVSRKEGLIHFRTMPMFVSY